MPAPTAKLFCYRVAESTLDAWCLSPDRSTAFRRVYYKLKLATLAVAAVDYGDASALTEAGRAAAWEELQLACTGQGEAGLEGFLAQLWGYCPEDDRATLRTVFESAFEAAEGLTERGAPRLYPAKYRSRSFTVLSDHPRARLRRAPYRGPRLRDLLEEDARLDGHIEAALAWFEALEAEERERAPRRWGHLELIESSDS